MPVRDLALLLLICLAWAGNLIAGARGMQHFTPFVFMALRFTILLLLLAPFFLVCGSTNDFHNCKNFVGFRRKCQRQISPEVTIKTSITPSVKQAYWKVGRKVLRVGNCCPGLHLA